MGEADLTKIERRELLEYLRAPKELHDLRGQRFCEAGNRQRPGMDRFNKMRGHEALAEAAFTRLHAVAQAGDDVSSN
jgi:hypothetical protein